MKYLWKVLEELGPDSEFSGGTTYESIICVKGELTEKSVIEEASKKIEDEEPMRLLRIERNRRLAETDWMALNDVIMSGEWKTYRQALRDLPVTAEPQLDDDGNLTNVIWPEVPA